MSKRAQQPVERRYVTEWVERTYPNPLAKIYNARVGPVSPDLRAMVPGRPTDFFKVFLSYADAVIVLENEIHVIEGKIYTPENGVAQLNKYARLIPQTEELKIWGARPVKKILLTWRETAPLREDAAANGVTLVIWRPPWLDPILKQRRLL